MENNQLFWLKELKKESYEKISFVFRKKPQKNKSLAWLDKQLYQWIDFKKQSYFSYDTDYLIISSNPLMSALILKMLHKHKIYNVFVHNLFIQDGFNYEILKNKEQMNNLLKNLGIETQDKDLALFSFLHQTSHLSNKNIFTVDKHICLTSYGEKFHDKWFFNTLYNSVKNEQFSEGYLYLWDEYKKSHAGVSRQWNFVKKSLDHQEKNKEDSHYLLFAKKIFVLSDNNPYLSEHFYNPEDKSIFLLDKVFDVEKFEKDFERFILVS